MVGICFIFFLNQRPFVLRHSDNDMHVPFSIFHSQFSFHYLQHRRGDFDEDLRKIFQIFSQFLIRRKSKDANSIMQNFQTIDKAPSLLYHITVIYNDVI